MPRPELPKNATLRTVWSTLDDPSHFIPAAYRVINRWQRDCGPVVLRLGVTGQGKRPNYRIDHAERGDILDVIDGNNHQPWSDEANLTGDWSSEAMSFEQVRELLSELRDRERARR